MYRLLLLLFCSTPAVAQFSISAPEQAAGDELITVAITGSTDEKDFVTIVAPDTPEGKYAKYSYVRSPKVTIHAPFSPGSYEVRLLDGASPYPTLAAQSIEISAATATLNAPDTVDAGSPIAIEWQGPNSQGDYLTIVPKGHPEKKYGDYVYVNKGSPATLRAPDKPGIYEIRYNVGRDNHTVERIEIEVTEIDVGLIAESTALIGTPVEIAWDGPGNQGDYITIVPKDYPDNKYEDYAYTKSNPVNIDAPEVPGDYEIRYMTSKNNTLARIPLTVAGVDSSLEAVASAIAGAQVEVTWDGPGNDRDYVTIVPVGTADGKYGNYAYVKDNPALLLTPEEPGDYEIRYQTANKNQVLTRRTITLTAASATLDLPEDVIAGRPFTVGWTGPNNPNDYVAITALDDQRRSISYFYTRRGNPGTLKAPVEPGIYAVHYFTGASDKSLASGEVSITPSKEPGTLVVRSRPADNTSASALGNAVEVVFDASGSMLQSMGNERRIDVAKAAVADLISTELPLGTPFAFRAFGHKQPGSCDTELLSDMAPLDPKILLPIVRDLEAKNLAKTPIAESLSQVPDDLVGVEGAAIVILVTDGEETCDGNPEAAIQQLRESGYDVRVNIVGFGIDEYALQTEFERLAELGGGAYFDAPDGAALARGISQAVAAPFSVLTDDGRRVASGFSNGDPITLSAGNYILVIGDNRHDITISAGETEEFVY